MMKTCWMDPDGAGLAVADGAGVSLGAAVVGVSVSVDTGVSVKAAVVGVSVSAEIVGVSVNTGAVGVSVTGEVVGVALGAGIVGVGEELGVDVDGGLLSVIISLGALAPDSREARLMAVEPGVITPKLYVPSPVI
jgi:hypothetical protein